MYNLVFLCIFSLLKYLPGYTNMKIFQQFKVMVLLSLYFLSHHSKETMGTQHPILFDRNLVSRSHVVCLFCSIVVSLVLCNLSQGFWERKMSQSKYTKLMLSLLHCKGQVVNSEAEHWQQESLGTQRFHLMKLRFQLQWSSQGTENCLFWFLNLLTVTNDVLYIIY